MNALETNNLTKIYVRDFIGTEFGRVKIRLKNRRVAALKNLNLNVNEGEIFGLLGPNGAGKTTAIKIFMGLIFPTRGSAKILDRPLGDKSVKAQIGFLPENPYFYDYLKGWEFLKYYAQLYSMPKNSRMSRIEELLHLVGLDDAANLPLKGYSKGMLQRIGLAQALLNDPRIVVLDEPQSGLDPFGRKEIRDIILSLKERGKTVFFSSHILSDAELICDRVGILFSGQLINVGYLTDLLSAQTKQYEIIAKNLSPQLADQIDNIAIKSISQKDEILFIVDSSHNADHIIKQIMDDKNAELISFTPRKESLEQYFIRQIKKGNN
jgi:ABC-2 type transport system ATP-binding protein